MGSLTPLLSGALWVCKHLLRGFSNYADNWIDQMLIDQPPANEVLVRLQQLLILGILLRPSQLRTLPTTPLLGETGRTSGAAPQRRAGTALTAGHHSWAQECGDPQLQLPALSRTPLDHCSVTECDFQGVCIYPMEEVGRTGAAESPFCTFIGEWIDQHIKGAPTHAGCEE